MKVQTIEEFLQEKENLASFTKYCEKKLCEENIAFWVDVQQYKSTNDTNKRRKIADHIFSHYVKQNAENQVHFDEPVVDEIKTSLDNNKLPQNLFEQAEKYVLCVLKCDVLPGYRKWKFVEDFKRDRTEIAGFQVVKEWKHGATSSPRDRKLTKKLERAKSKLLLQSA